MTNAKIYLKYYITNKLIISNYKTVSLKPLRDKNEFIWWCAKHVCGKNPIDPSSSFCTSNVDLPIRFNKCTWSPRLTENVFIPFVFDNNDEFSYSCQTRNNCFRGYFSLFIEDDDDDEYNDDDVNDVRSESSSIAAKLSSPKTFEFVDKLFDWWQRVIPIVVKWRRFGSENTGDDV